MMMIMMITCVSEILSNTVAVYETAGTRAGEKG